MKYPLLILFYFSLSFHLFSQDKFECFIIDDRGEIREHNVDYKKLVLELSFVENENKIKGKANYLFSPLRESINHLFLDAPNISIISIFLAGKKVKFKETKDGVDVFFKYDLSWDNEYEMLIEYETTPQKGMYFVGWNDKTNRSRKQIWTQGQGIDNRHWIPGYDGVNDKLITETIITFKNGFEVISNGELISKEIHKDNTTTWHYAMNKPHALYLMMIAIGKYDHKDYISNNGIKSIQYYYPDKIMAESVTYKYTNEMMDWFEDELGLSYQWDIYKNVPVQDFMYGAMENTSATIFTDYYLQNAKESLERNYVGTNAHELAHQWFGDYVTEWNGSSHWLHESFATHYSKQFLRSVKGEDFYRWACRNEQNAILSASLKNDYPIGYTNSGSSRHYSKGSYVLDMLRYVVGEAEYKKTVNVYLKNHALDMVDSHDFQMAFMKTLGLNLDWFFKQWIFKGGEPEYEIDYELKINKTIISVKQIHEQNDLVSLFKMPIKIQIHYKDGTFIEELSIIEHAEQTIEIHNKGMKKVDYILFDPNSEVLKKVKFDRPFKALIAQATKAKNMIDRHDAILALRSIEVSKKRDLLVDIYLEDDYLAIKNEILFQLKNDNAVKSEQLFAYALGEKEVKIRRKAIDNLSIRNKRYLKFYIDVLDDDSYVNAELMLIKLCEKFPSMIPEFLERTIQKKEEKLSFKLTWLKYSYGMNQKMYGEMVDYTSSSFDFRTRIKAINILSSVGYSDHNYIKNLMDAYVHFNRRLIKPASRQLKTLLTDDENKKIFSNYIYNQKWLSFQKDKLKNLIDKK